MFSGRDGRSKAELHPGNIAGLEPFPIEQGDASRQFRGARKNVDLVVLLQRHRGAGKKPKTGVKSLAGNHQTGGRQHIAALNLVDGDSGEIDRGSAPRECPGDFFLVTLQPAHAYAPIMGIEPELIPDGDFASAQCAGDDCAESSHGEDAIHWQAGCFRVRLAGCEREDFLQLSQKSGKSFTGQSGHRDDRRAGEGGWGEAIADLFAHQIEPIGIDGVYFRQNDDAAIDPQEVEDRQMLVCLWHRAFVRGDDKHGHVDAAHAGEHVLDEPLMAGNVDHADSLATWQRQPGEAEIDGHRSRFLLGQAIGIDAGEGFDQRRFAVVDVTGRADHKGPERFGTVSHG